MFVDLDWPLNASSLLSASAELLVSFQLQLYVDSQLKANLVYVRRWCWTSEHHQFSNNTLRWADWFLYVQFRRGSISWRCVFIIARIKRPVWVTACGKRRAGGVEIIRDLFGHYSCDSFWQTPPPLDSINCTARRRLNPLSATSIRPATNQPIDRPTHWLSAFCCTCSVALSFRSDI